MARSDFSELVIMLEYNGALLLGSRRDLQLLSHGKVSLFVHKLLGKMLIANDRYERLLS